jgi:hypothetical protein
MRGGMEVAGHNMLVFWSETTLHLVEDCGSRWIKRVVFDVWLWLHKRDGTMKCQGDALPGPQVSELG